MVILIWSNVMKINHIELRISKPSFCWGLRLNCKTSLFPIISEKIELAADIDLFIEFLIFF